MSIDGIQKKINSIKDLKQKKNITVRRIKIKSNKKKQSIKWWN